METIFTRDYSESSWKAEGFHKTKEGYLTGSILVTCAGVFPYLGDGGKIINRLRSMDEVRESVKTLVNKPVTLNHPSELVTPDNAKKLSVGFCSNDVFWDGINAFVTCTITDRKAIEAIQNGEVRAVSCGYTCNIDDESGVWNGTFYDQLQRNIEYNHIALVYAGRAGDGVKFQVNDSAEFLDFSTKDKTMTKKIIIDSVEHEADEAVITAYQKALDSAKEMQVALDKANAGKDAAEALCKQKDEEIESLKASQLDEAEIAKRVDARMRILAIAKDAGMEKAEDKTDAEIRAFVISKAFPKISLDGKSEDYVNAMFDAAQSVKVEKQADNTLAGDKGNETISEDGTDEDVVKAKAEYDAMFNNEKKES